tara:strand:- start:108732 stop:109388 length:657 start_codon:yes stop_codon:yes gene_type:complete
MEIKINGVYSNEVVTFLKSLGVNNFGFDLRPTSFNFVQLHIIQDIVKVNPNCTFTFLFQNEKDFVIKELVNFVCHETPLQKEQVLLEFTDIHDIDSCESFEMNYIWHFSDLTNYRKILHAKYLRVISLSQNHMQDYQEKQQFFPLLKELYELKRPSNLLDLRINWTEAPGESIIDFIKPNLLTLEIDNSVQSSYRQLDNQIIQIHLSHIKEMLSGGVA